MPPEVGTKDTWGNKAEFLMAALGTAIGLGNLWRFPYQCYANGGGAFLIPFFLMVLLVAFPQVLADFSFSQFSSKGSLRCWDGTPIMSGIGWTIMSMSYVVNCYYTLVVSYGVFYMFASFTKTLPWSSCGNWWNTPSCLDIASILHRKECLSDNGHWRNSTCVQITNFSAALNESMEVTLNNSYIVNPSSPGDEYFHNYLLQITSDIYQLGTIRWPIVLCLAFCIVLAFIMLIFGVRSWGKVSYVTTLLPYVVLSALLIQCLTKKGSGQGILYLLTPRWEKLASLTVWSDAAVQAYFSLGASGGSILTLGSHNKFRNNCLKDSLVLAISDVLTSLFCGIVVFATIGMMAAEVDVHIDRVVGQGAGLTFVVYSEMISRMPASPVWSVMFNFTLISLGIGAVVASLNLIQVNVSDTFPKLVSNRPRSIGVLGILSILWLFGGLMYTTQGGMYLLQMMDANVTFVHLFLGFAKGIALAWVYGVNRLCTDIKQMTGWNIPKPFRYIYKFLTPAIICLIIVMKFVGLKPLKYRFYTYPGWCTFVSGGLAVLLALFIPAVAIYKVVFTNSDLPLRQRLQVLTTPCPGWGRLTAKALGEESGPDSLPLNKVTV